MNTLFICTSNKDRSPALEKYFSDKYKGVTDKQFRSAGINKFFCMKKGTHYLEQADIDWADLIVFAEAIHQEITMRKFIIIGRKKTKMLNLGNYAPDTMDDYITKAEYELRFFI